MATNQSSVREQLTYSAVLQIVLIAACVILLVYVILPKFNDIQAQTQQTNETIARYEETSTNGIAFSGIAAAAKAVGNNSELLEIIKNNEEATKEVIKKTSNAPYLEWLKDALKNSDEDRKKLALAKAKINSIIPTLSPISGNIDEVNITLREYIEYVEQEILKKYSLKSSSPLGIDGVKYDSPDATSGISNPIGHFDVTLNFEASNRNIINFLDYLKATGSPDILNTASAMTDADPNNLPVVMSNPLITVESLSLKESLNPLYPNLENSGRITLRLYVRGSSQTDQQFLKDTLKKRMDAFQKTLTDTLTNCTSTVTSCPQLADLQSIDSKFREMGKSFDTIASKASADNISNVYVLAQQAQTLKTLENEFNAILR